MTLNEYQEKAMKTCMSSCDNIAYMLTGLNAEVGVEKICHVLGAKIEIK